MRNKMSKGFTLMELMIVVAIIAVLVSIGIPAFSSSLEKSREAADLANIRSAYTDVILNALLEDTADSITIDLVQKKAGWDTATADDTLTGLTKSHVEGSPSDGNNTALIEWLEDEQAVKISFNGSSSGNGVTGDDSGSGSTNNMSIHASGNGSFDPGTVFQDETGTCVIVSGGTWTMLNEYNNGLTVRQLCDKYSSLAMVNTSDIKDSQFTGTLSVGDLYYDSGSGSYYYVSYVNSESWPASGWVKLLQ